MRNWPLFVAFIGGVILAVWLYGWAESVGLDKPFGQLLIALSATAFGAVTISTMVDYFSRLRERQRYAASAGRALNDIKMAIDDLLDTYAICFVEDRQEYVARTWQLYANNRAKLRGSDLKNGAITADQFQMTLDKVEPLVAEEWAKRLNLLSIESFVGRPLATMYDVSRKISGTIGRLEEIRNLRGYALSPEVLGEAADITKRLQGLLYQFADASHFNDSLPVPLTAFDAMGRDDAWIVHHSLGVVLQIRSILETLKR